MNIIFKQPLYRILLEAGLWVIILFLVFNNINIQYQSYLYLLALIIWSFFYIFQRVYSVELNTDNCKITFKWIFNIKKPITVNANDIETLESNIFYGRGKYKVVHFIDIIKSKPIVKLGFSWTDAHLKDISENVNKMKNTVIWNNQ